MSQTKVTKSKGKQERPKLKVMHRLDKDDNGNATIKSIVTNPPKLREAVGNDKVQAAEETAHKTSNGNISELDHKILKALDALGGKDVASIDIAKKVGTTKTHPDAPRAPIRRAMEAFEKLGYAKSEKKGAKYLFSITEEGKHFLTQPPKSQAKPKDKGAPNPAPASTASSGSDHQAYSTPAAETRPANTDRQCGTCRTWNPFGADFCKQCGKPMKPVETVAKAAPAVVAA